MKIVFIATRPYYPVCDGRTYTLNQYIRALCEDHEVHYVCFSDDGVINNIHGCKSVTLLKNSSTKEKLGNLLSKSLFGGKPLQCAAVYSKTNQKIINDVVRSASPDIIIFDMIRMASYKRKLPKSKTTKYILDMDDILSNRYNKESKESILGTFCNKVPDSINKIFKNKTINRIITSSERRRMRRLEKKAPRKFDNVVLVSQKEVSYLKEVSKKDNVYCWPAIVDVSKDPQISTIYDKKSLLFLGNLYVPQNLATFDYIINEIMPSFTDFTLKVVGKASEELKNRKYSCNIIFKDYVENLEQEAKTCLALIAPIQFGTGIKIKVIEMMGIGLPVVTSLIGIEGLDIRKEDGYLVCENQVDYISNIFNLYKEPIFRKSIIEKQLKFIREFHNFNLLKETIKKTFEEITK